MPGNMLENSYKIQISSASLSLISSLFIATGVIKSDGGLTSTYRRIIFGISVSDILQSLTIIIGPFAVPSSTPVGLWAVGNEYTCEAQGVFYIFAGGCTPMYMFALCLYTAFKVKKERNAEFPRRSETLMHACIIAINLCMVTIGLVTKSIHSYVFGGTCGFAAFPTGCRQNPDLFGECEKNLSIVSYLITVSILGIPLVCLFGVACCMLSICVRIFSSRSTGLTSSHRHGRRRLRTQELRNIKRTPRQEMEDSELGSRATSYNSSILKITTAPCNSSPAVVVDNSTTSQLEVGSKNQTIDSPPDVEKDESSTLQDRDETSLQNEWTKKIQLHRREIHLQAWWFILAFLATFGLSIVTNIVLLMEFSPSDSLIYATLWSYPLGGFFNMLAYTRPKIAARRIRHPESSWLQAFWWVIRTGGNSYQPEQDLAHVSASLAFGAHEMKVGNSLIHGLSGACVYDQGQKSVSFDKNDITHNSNAEVALRKNPLTSSSGDVLTPITSRLSGENNVNPVTSSFNSSSVGYSDLDNFRNESGGEMLAPYGDDFSNSKSMEEQLVQSDSPAVPVEKAFQTAKDRIAKYRLHAT